MRFQCPTPFLTLATTPLRSASIAIWQALRTAPYRHDRTVTLHHPRIPGYPLPLICGVIRLREGVNLVANIAGVEEQALAIGMRVQGRVEQVDEKTMLPQFYPAENGVEK